MLTDELTRPQTRAAIQAEERNPCHEARPCSHPTVLHSFSSTQTGTSTIPMEDRHYSTILNSIPSFSGTLHQNIAERLDIVSLKFDIIVTILDKAADLSSNI